ncbi:hypothetical protein ACFL5O_09900 [Myxococcota bacterium]
MPKQPPCIKWMAQGALCAWVVSIVVACDSSTPDLGPTSTPRRAGSGGTAPKGVAGAPTETALSASGGAATIVVVEVDNDPSSGEVTPACTGSVTCEQEGAQYCGSIGDGCGRTIDCGPCSGDWTCDDHICVGGPSCEPISCQTGTTKFCGEVGDGCGRALDCGACAEGENCQQGVCVKEGCVPLTCESEEGHFCGTIGDACGGTLECGDCSDGDGCGGGRGPKLVLEPDLPPSWMHRPERRTVLRDDQRRLWWRAGLRILRE